ncbi:MAG: glutathione S-transferase family protein [Betaproteobacteria bacterium]
MIKFWYNLAPNPMKVALLLEELGVPYEPIPVDTRKGEQHAESFKAVNPNAKVPASDDGGVVMFDSNAILLWLADKYGRFVARDPASAERADTLAWLMFIASGVGPFSGQAVHFRTAAPEPKEYALNRYDFEAHRHWSILNDRLARRQWLAGNDYGIVDRAFGGWARMVPFVLDDKQAWDKYPHHKRLLDAINARPAAARVEALRQRHTFKTELDDEARRAMFPQNERLRKA